LSGECRVSPKSKGTTSTYGCDVLNSISTTTARHNKENETLHPKTITKGKNRKTNTNTKPVPKHRKKQKTTPLLSIQQTKILPQL
jgi:hypothetical protein